jgi:MinD-like ATPase involved in chromosome partitioning or flagellar assembly
MSKLISIHSFRGGTGKSNLVANVAASLAVSGCRVGIVDTDIQSPGIHVLFGVDLKQVPHTLNDYLMGRCAIADPVFDVTQSLSPEVSKILQQAGGSLYLIPASMKVDEITTILSRGYDISLLTQGYKVFIEALGLDYLLIDTHPGINEETLLSMGISDLLIVVLRTDQQDFQGTALTVRVAKQLGIPEMFLVVNQCLPEFNPEDVKDTLETALSTPVRGILPLATDMIRLGSRDIFCLKYPEHPLSIAIEQVVACIR